MQESVILSLEIRQAAIFVLLLLTPLAPLGLAMAYAGFTRSRNAAHAVFGALSIFAVAAVTFFAVGFALLQGEPGWAEIGVTAHGTHWSMAGAGPFFLHGFPYRQTNAVLVFALQLVMVGAAAMIPLGAGGGRWRLRPMMIFTGIFAGVIYPLFSHWTLRGGCLRQVEPYFDFGGAGAIHAAGGLAALAVAWLLGARRGRFLSDGMPTAIPAHNAVYILLGCVLMLPGWAAMTSAASLAFSRAPIVQMPFVFINMTLAASAAAITAALGTRWRFGKPDASLAANGWIAGIAAVSAGGAYMTPFAAMFVGAVAGVLAPLMVVLMESYLNIDDPAGAIASHAVGGIWGLAAAGVFVRGAMAYSGPPRAALELGYSGNFLAQLIGIFTLLGFVLPACYGALWAINRLTPLRCSAQEEHQGLDLGELGAGAYPEFITRTDEFGLR